MVLYDSRSQHQVAIQHVSVGAPDIDGTGCALTRRHRPSSNAQDGVVVHDLGAVQDNGHMALVRRNVYGLPFAGRLFGRDTWRNPAVKPAHAERVNRFFVGICDLDFIDAARVYAAVTTFGYVDLQRQLEVLESGIRA